MDQVRIWLARLAAPLAFLAAATALVVVVQRALDEDPAANPDPAAVTDPSTDGEESPPADTGVDEVPEKDREFYRIEQGDTLEDIAAEFGTTVDTLLALNPDVDQLTLQIGQRIRVK